MAEHTIYYKNQPRIVSAYAVAGPKEGAGPIGRHIQKILEDDKFGEKTYEKAECKILRTAIEGAISSARIEIKDVGALFSGDLLNQIISASFAAREFDMPFVGLYSACSTMSEAMMVSSAFWIPSSYAMPSPQRAVTFLRQNVNIVTPWSLAVLDHRNRNGR